ncbi:hypothetical protein EDC94DRAFT_644157 [Helicostylum pulchrum]|nr:hypothetical protein EDC94DRAFT_644157 [Helicostylum pulchrum]
MEEFKNSEVCYKDDPTYPLLLPLVRLNANAYTYKKYFSDDVCSLDVNGKENLSLETEAQIIHYLNEVYLPQYPFAGELYEFKQVLTTEIFANLIQYTPFFDKKTPHGFSNWCSKKDLKLLEVNTGIKRLRSSSSTGRYRSLYVLKKEHHQELLRSIVEHLPKYQDFLCKLKDEGYQIVGYARKPPRINCRYFITFSI